MKNILLWLLTVVVEGMSDNTDRSFVDFYEVLQISPKAEGETIPAGVSAPGAALPP